jgi:hypothetical protein
MDHHRNDCRDAAVPDWQPSGVGPDHGQATTSVAQHPGREIDADGRPAQLADQGGVDTGAAADLKAKTRALAEELTQRPVDTQRVARIATQA